MAKILSKLPETLEIKPGKRRTPEQDKAKYDRKMAKIRSDPKLYEEYRAKDRARYIPRKKPIKLVTSEMFPVLFGIEQIGNGKRYLTTVREDPCSYCNSPIGRKEIDHISCTELSGKARLGKASYSMKDWSNLTSSCQRCNWDKGRSSLLEFLAWPTGWLR